MPRMPKLEFQNVSLVYEDMRRSKASLHALDNLSLSVNAGESIAIIGPSGCGKSSTLQMAAGLLAPTQGRVLIDGAPVTKPRHQTALILQDFGLLPWKTVIDNATLGLKVRGMDREARNAKAREALALVGLEGFERAYPGELSGGMQQRLALARSIALDVDLLLMDEPLSALDALLREQLQDTLLELWRKESYAQVLVTHSIDEAVYLGQRIVVMSQRPGHVMSVKDNPGMGDKDYRGSLAYYELINEIRDLLRADAKGSSPSPDQQEAVHA